MKKIMPYIAGVFFALFGAGVIALLMSYTFSALAHVFPDNFTAQVMGMVLFDIAALAWLGAFIYLCQSVMQYAFAFIGFVFGLAGSLVMVAIEVMLGGQQMIDAPEWVNQALIYGFIAAAVVHVVLYYAYKLAAPEISAEISLGVETAQITEEAMKQAELQLMKERGALGGVIAPRLIANVRRNLGLPVSGDYIDAPAYDVAETPMPVQIPAHEMNWLERLQAAGKILINPSAIAPRHYNANVATVYPPTPQTMPTPITPQEPAQTVPTPITPQEPAQTVPTPITPQEPAQTVPTPITPQEPAQIVPTPLYHPAYFETNEREAAEGQAVPLVGFSGNGNDPNPQK